jgi:hypothetical protein
MFKTYAIDLALRQSLPRVLRRAGYAIGEWRQQTISFDKPYRLCTALHPQAITVVVYFANSLRWTQNDRQNIASDLQEQGIESCRVLVMGEKFAWLLSDFANNAWTNPLRHKKPGPLAHALLA